MLDTKGYAKFPKEIKPTPADVCVATCILLHAAQLAGERVFFFTDDAKNFFNQMALGVQDRWQNATFMFDYKKQTFVMVEELCMSFGYSPASNIAQRLAILIVDIVKLNFDAEERQRIEDGNADEFTVWWFKMRDELAEKTGKVEARLYMLEMYTDDPMGGVVGADRMSRFLICWTRTTRKMGLWMAGPVKRQLGASVNWIGARYFSIGVVLIAKDKRMRALCQLKQILSGGLKMSELRSLNGLLEFFMVILKMGRDKMAGMWEPFQDEQADWWSGPDSIPALSTFRRQNTHSWVTKVSTVCAAPFSVALTNTDMAHMVPMFQG